MSVPKFCFVRHCGLARRVRACFSIDGRTKYSTFKMRIVVLNQCEREIAGFPLPVKEELADAMALLEIGEVLAPPASKPLGKIAKGLHELRLRDSSGQYRVIYLMRSRDAIYLLHAFKKKSQQIELRVLKTILERLRQL